MGNLVQMQFDAQGDEVTVDGSNGIQTKEQAAAEPSHKGGAQAVDVDALNASLMRASDEISKPGQAARDLELLKGTIAQYNELQQMEEQLVLSGKKLTPHQKERMGHLMRDVTTQALRVPGALEQLGITID